MLMFAAMLAMLPPVERRCGWLHNPTPGNWWLTDRDGQWVLSTQGGPEVAGWDTVGPTQPAEWVKTNGYYGYGCSCAQIRVDRRDGSVVEIKRLSSRPLKACRADRRLPKP